MSRGKHSKKSEKKITNFLFFYFVIVIFVVANYTFSRYTATSESAPTITVARFNIAVNDAPVGTQTNTFDLILNSETTTFNNKIVPDSEGYFEVVINPNGTDVSLEYQVAFDLTQIIADNKKISLTQYSLDNGTTFIAMPTDNIILGEINLSDTQTGLTEADKVTIRVYWEWDQDIVNPTFNNTSIIVNSAVKQKI